MVTKPTGNKSQGDFTHTIFKQMVNPNRTALKDQIAEKIQHGTYTKKHLQKRPQ